MHERCDHNWMELKSKWVNAYNTLAMQAGHKSTPSSIKSKNPAHQDSHECMGAWARGQGV